MHLKNRSFRETNVLQSLGAPRGPIILPGPSEAPPGLQLHNHNLGGVAYRKHSHRSLQDASFRAQRQS